MCSKVLIDRVSTLTYVRTRTPALLIDDRAPRLTDHVTEKLG